MLEYSVNIASSLFFVTSRLFPNEIKMCLFKVGLYSVYKGYGPVLETKGPNSTTVANVSTLLNGKTVKIN